MDRMSIEGGRLALVKMGERILALIESPLANDEEVIEILDGLSDDHHALTTFLSIIAVENILEDGVQTPLGWCRMGIADRRVEQ